MPGIGTSTTELNNSIPQKCLARIFGGSFNRFFNEALKSLLQDVAISIRKNDAGENVAVGLSDEKLWGARAIFIARNYYTKYEYREYLGEERDFVNGFSSELSFIIFEIIKKEHL
jgi:hypothetical protein